MTFATKAPPGTKVFHCTPRENEESIRRLGLRPTDAVKPNGVYFFWRLDVARGGRLPGEIMLELDIGGLEVLDDPMDGRLAAGYTPHHLDPERIGRRVP